jgi:hypothetical protein
LRAPTAVTAKIGIATSNYWRFFALGRKRRSELNDD